MSSGAGVSAKPYLNPDAFICLRGDGPTDIGGAFCGKK